MRTHTEERASARLACRTFIGLSAVISTYGVWAKGMFPAALGVIAMGVCLYLLSQAVERIQEAWNNDHKISALIVAGMAAGFVLVEANLNHIGLELLNAEYDLAPAWAIWPACVFISLVNVFGDYGFARALPLRQPARPALPAPETVEENPARVMALKSWEARRGRKAG